MRDWGGIRMFKYLYDDPKFLHLCAKFMQKLRIYHLCLRHRQTQLLFSGVFSARSSLTNSGIVFVLFRLVLRLTYLLKLPCFYLLARTALANIVCYPLSRDRRESI